MVNNEGVRLFSKTCYSQTFLQSWFLTTNLDFHECSQRYKNKNLENLISASITGHIKYINNNKYGFCLTDLDYGIYYSNLFDTNFVIKQGIMSLVDFFTKSHFLLIINYNLIMLFIHKIVNVSSKIEKGMK
ncbi:hypothetical protein BpHYR1_053829, partial [Brachionus plicatilis]